MSVTVLFPPVASSIAVIVSILVLVVAPDAMVSVVPPIHVKSVEFVGLTATSTVAGAAAPSVACTVVELPAPLSAIVVVPRARLIGIASLSSIVRVAE